MIYLAIGLWLRPTPALSGEMKETVIFTKGFYFLSAAFIVLIIMLRKKIYYRSPLVPPSPQEVLKQMSFNKVVGHWLIYVLSRSDWAVWVDLFVSDGFRSALLEFNARVHYFDGLTLPP